MFLDRKDSKFNAKTCEGLYRTSNSRIFPLIQCFCKISNKRYILGRDYKIEIEPCPLSKNSGADRLPYWLIHSCDANDTLILDRPQRGLIPFIDRKSRLDLVSLGEFWYNIRASPLSIPPKKKKLSSHHGPDLMPRFVNWADSTPGPFKWVKARSDIGWWKKFKTGFSGNHLGSFFHFTFALSRVIAFDPAGHLNVIFPSTLARKNHVNRQIS